MPSTITPSQSEILRSSSAMVGSEKNGLSSAASNEQNVKIHDNELNP